MEAESSVAYPVLFREYGAVPVAGSLTVTPGRVILEGGAGDGRSMRIELGELRQIRIARSPAERMNGHRVLVLERSSGPDVHIAPLGVGLLHEIADLMANVAGLDGRDPTTGGETAVVAVPLRPGAEHTARDLVASGPPFDPAELELTSHRVFFVESELLFVFSGPDVRRRIRDIAREPNLWRAGLKWRGSLAGAPRLLPEATTLPRDAELVYEWRTG